MGTFGPVTSGCERARTWASLELDGELSELERALLGSHLVRCEACAAAVAEMRSVTAALRAAPLEAPERPAFVARARGEHRHPGVPVRIALAATLAALAAGLGALTGSLAKGPSRAAPVVTDVALLPASSRESFDVRAQRGVEVVKLGQQRAFPPGRLGGNV